MKYKDTYKKTIPPLLSTNYGNSSNAATLVMPANTTRHLPPGCSAIAFSQIIYYWGIKRYDDNQSFTVRNGSWKVLDYDTGNSLGHVDRQGKDCSGYASTTRQIHWSKIPLQRNFLHNYSINSSYNSTSKRYVLTNSTKVDNEFAEFKLDCAMSINSNFGEAKGAGGTSCSWNASSGGYNTGYNNFNLSNYTFSGSNIEKYEDDVYSELANGRPVSMAGWRTDNKSGGHAFICDGYSNGLFHINFGWGGNKDGWYPLGALCGYVQVGGHNSPSVSVENTGDSGMSYSNNVAIRRVYPKNTTPATIDYSLKQYKNTSFYNRNLYNDLRIIDIDTKFCDGNIVPVNGSYKIRNQSLKVTFINKSKNDYYNTNLFIYIGSVKVDTFTFNAAAGETVYHELRVSPSYSSLKEGTYSITIKASVNGNNVVLLGLDDNPYTKSITFVKRTSYSPIVFAKNLGFSIFRNYITSRKLAANTLFICLGGFGGTDQNVINTNNYPIYLNITLWFWVCNPGTLTATYHSDMRSHASVNVKTIIPANAKGEDVRIPIVVQNLPKGMSFKLRYEYYDEFGKCQNTDTIVLTNYPTINYWTSEGDTSDYIVVNNEANYTNSDIVVEDNMLAIEFSGITCKSITPNDNPNTIYIFDANQSVPASLNGKNIIKGDVAETINLYEGYEMYFPKTFTAKKVIYHYTPKNGITKGTNKGWKTISFPFDVKEVKCDDKVIDWFHSDTDTRKQFWLKGFDGIEYDDLVKGSQYDICWKNVNTIEKNTSYIIAFPGESYGKNNLVNKEILFIGENCEFNQSNGFGFKDGYEKTISDDAATNNEIYTVSPENIYTYPWCPGIHPVWNSTNYKQTTKAIDFCGTTLNRKEKYIYRLSEDGSTFEYSESAQNILPFEAYFKDAYRRIYENNDLYKTSKPSKIRKQRTSVETIDTGFEPVDVEDNYQFVEPCVDSLF